MTVVFTQEYWLSLCPAVGQHVPNVSGRCPACSYQRWPCDYAELAHEKAQLVAVLEQALAHVEELEDAWMRGNISEHDGLGGTRSNRNHDVRVALTKVLRKVKGEVSPP